MERVGAAGGGSGKTPRYVGFGFKENKNQTSSERGTLAFF